MGDSERQPEKENGGGVVSEGGRDNETVGCARVWMCVDCDWPPFGCGSVGGGNVGV